MKSSKRIILAACLMLAFTASGGGIDLHLNYRAENSRWQYGLRFVTWTEEWKTASGTGLSETTTTKLGPTLNHLFTPDSRGSWYLGASVLHWTQDERSSRTGSSDKASTVAPFFGGGYTARLGSRG